MLTMSTPLRRWLSILLLIWLPLQFSWAAAASQCRHEEGQAAQHLGHHLHLHKKAPADEPDSKKEAGAKVAVDADCAHCHLSSMQSIAASPLHMAGETGQAPVPDLPDRYRSHVPSGPERPQRPLAARFGETAFFLNIHR